MAFVHVAALITAIDNLQQRLVGSDDEPLPREVPPFLLEPLSMATFFLRLTRKKATVRDNITTLETTPATTAIRVLVLPLLFLFELGRGTSGLWMRVWVRSSEITCCVVDLEKFNCVYLSVLGQAFRVRMHFQ